MSVQLLPSTAISSGEPVIARISIHNLTAETLWLAIGDTQMPALCLTVRDPRGVVVATCPEGNSGLDRTSPLYTLPPHGSQVMEAVLTGMARFEVVGTYEVDSVLYEWGSRKPLASAQKLTVEVTPADPGRLEISCETIFRPLRPPKVYNDALSSEIRALALCSVQHDVVLPYLDWLARERRYRRACVAMRRLQTPRAIRILNELCARSDAVGLVTQEAIKVAITPSPEDVWP